MNKRRTIYKGFNKRKKNRELKIIAVALGIFIVSGYGYVKLKNSDFIGEIAKKIEPSGEEDKFLDSSDYGIEENNEEDVKDTSSETTEEATKTEEVEDTNQDIKVAKVDPLTVYTIQVASVQDDKDMNKIETELLANNIPHSVVEMDGTKKVQTYTFFDKEVTRQYLDETKAVFPDAFISEMTVPVLALEYTTKYSYIENISTKLNELIKNFEEESIFWSTSKDNINIDEYNKVLESRKTIVSDLQKEAEKIDYEEMNVFKDNLITYTKTVNEEIDNSLKAAKDNEYDVSKSLQLSSMQGYFSFINSIKGA